MPAVAFGRTFSRMSCTSFSVALACGPVAGISVAMAAWPDGLVRKSVTSTTPGVARRAAVTADSDVREVEPVTSATTSMGPLAPAPNPVAVRS